MQIKYAGCDISHHQGNVDFSKLKHEVDFVILKLGGSDTRDGKMYKDNKFDTYYNECKKNGIPVGCYWFAGKLSTGRARAAIEGATVYRLVKDLKFEMPIYIDFEIGSTKNKLMNTEFCVYWCNYLENRKCFVGIYSSDISGFKNMLNDCDLKNYSHWVARYNSRPAYVSDWGMWQYSSKGKLKGITGNVDLDYSTLNFPKIIRTKHLNGW